MKKFILRILLLFGYLTMGGGIVEASSAPANQVTNLFGNIGISPTKYHFGTMDKQYVFWRSDLSNGWLELMSYNPVEEGDYKTSKRIMESINSIKYDSRLISQIDRSCLTPRDLTYCYTNINDRKYYTNYNDIYAWVPELSDLPEWQNPTPVSF